MLNSILYSDLRQGVNRILISSPREAGLERDFVHLFVVVALDLESHFGNCVTWVLDK